MADTESVLSFVPPTLPPSSVCSLNFPLFADRFISPSMPDRFPAFSKQHNRRMDSSGVRARHCIPFSHFCTGFLFSWRSFRWGELSAVPWLRGQVWKNLRASSPHEKLLEKRWSTFQTVRVTWNRMKEAGLSERAALSIVCHLTQDKRSLVLASRQLTRGALSCQRQSGQTIAFPFYK